jgi:hypothetical protein
MVIQIDTSHQVTGELNQTQPWSSINTKTGVYRQTPDQMQKMQQAMITASMSTPAEALRVYAPTGVVAVSSTAGQPTIEDVLNRSAGVAPQMSIFDYSGTPAGTMASAVPSLPIGP